MNRLNCWNCRFPACCWNQMKSSFQYKPTQLGLVSHTFYNLKNISWTTTKAYALVWLIYYGGVGSFSLVHTQTRSYMVTNMLYKYTPLFLHRYHKRLQLQHILWSKWVLSSKTDLYKGLTFFFVELSLKYSVVSLLQITFLVHCIVDCYFSDVTSVPTETVVTEVGANLTLACPGVTEHSLVSVLEWYCEGCSHIQPGSSQQSSSHHGVSVSTFPFSYILSYHCYIRLATSNMHTFF